MAPSAFNPPMSWRSSLPPPFNDSLFLPPTIQGKKQKENGSVLGGVAGHAGVFSPAHDVAIFANAMLNEGQPILHSETLAIFTRRELSPTGTCRALGWDTPSLPSQSGKHFSPHSFGHLGYTG